MKKIILLFIALILFACSPQVTVTSEVTVTLPPPTQTPIPTPTLHPEFEQLQATVADTEKFTLTSVEGGLLYDGSPVPGVTVERDGSINLELADGKVVTLDPTEVSFDDVSGFSAEGYELNENDEWVESVLTPEQMVMEIFEQNGVDVERFNNETVTVNPSEDGNGFSVTDNKTGKVLMENDGTQTKFEIGFVTDEIAAKSCEPTNFSPEANNPAVTKEDFSGLAYYTNDTVTRSGGELQFTDPYFNILINRDLQCWGASEGQHFYYRDKDGVSYEIPLIGLTKDEIIQYLFSRE